MEESPVGQPDSTGLYKPETVSGKVHNSFTGSSDNLLYGNETESLVTEKLLDNSEQSHSEGSKKENAKSSSNSFPLLQPRCLKTSNQQLQNDVLPVKDSDATTLSVTDPLTSYKIHEENKNEFEIELDAKYSGSDTDHIERPPSCENLNTQSEKETDLKEKNTQAKRLQALSLVAVYTDSGNDSEEELRVNNQDVQDGVEPENKKTSNCSQNVDQNTAKIIEQTSATVTSDSKTVLSEADLSDQFLKISHVTATVCNEVNLKNCKWSEDDEEQLNTECEIVKKLESGTSSDEIDKNNDQSPSTDLDANEAKKVKHSLSHEKKHKKRKKKKKKIRKSSSYSTDQDRGVKEKRKERSRSRHDSSKEKRNKNYYSDDSEEYKSQNQRDYRRTRSRSRTRSPRRKYRHYSSRSRSRDRSHSHSKSFSRRNRHSRSRSRNRSSRRSHYSHSRRKSSRRRSYSRSRSRPQDRGSKSSLSHRRRERSPERHVERKQSHRSSRGRSSESKRPYSPQSKDSTDNRLPCKRENPSALLQTNKDSLSQQSNKLSPSHQTNNDGPSHQTNIPSPTQQINKLSAAHNNDSLSQQTNKDSPTQQTNISLQTPNSCVLEEEKKKNKKAQLSSGKSTEKQTKHSKTKKDSIPHKKEENSDEELWAELEQLTYSSGRSSNQIGKLDSKLGPKGLDSALKTGGDIPTSSVKDDILPLVSSPISPNQEKNRPKKNENINIGSKSAGQSLRNPIKQFLKDSKFEFRKDSKPEDQDLVGTTTKGSVSNESSVPSTDLSLDKRQNEDVGTQSSAEVPQLADQQQKPNVEVLPQEKQLDSESNLESGSASNANLQKSPKVEVKHLETKPSLIPVSRLDDTKMYSKESDDLKITQQHTAADKNCKDEEENQSKFHTPPRSQIKPFISHLQPTVIPGLDLMNPNFKSPPPPPSFNPGVMNTPTQVNLPPPPFPPWARFPPTPGQHNFPPPPFLPPSLLPLQQPPHWGRTDIQQNVAVLPQQNQNSVNQPCFPSQGNEVKMPSPIMETVALEETKEQVESSNNTGNSARTKVKTSVEEPDSEGASFQETEGNHGDKHAGSLSSPVDMEMSSPEVDIIDKLNEEFWELENPDVKKPTEVNEDAVHIEDYKCSPTTPPPQDLPASPPYSPRGEVVNLDVPEVLQLKQKKTTKKEKSRKKKSTLSAKSLSVIDRIHRQARVDEEAKHVLRIYYKHRDINKEEYKTILRKIVPQVSNSNHSIDPERIRHLVKKYVAKVKGQRLLKQT